VDELAAVEGMTRPAAQKLHEFLLDAAHEATPLPGEE